MTGHGLDEDVVCGEYKVGAVVRRTVASTIYEAELVNGQIENRPAVIRMREGDNPEQWREAAKLEHPNLLRILDVGTCMFEGTEMTWAVMQKADQSLAGVLQVRPLTKTEIEEMLGPVVAGLGYLHKNGYAHGSLKPSNVMAIGNDVKLSSDRVISGGSKPEDIRALGVLVVEALTQKRPEQVDAAEYGLDFGKDAISDIVRNCLESDPAKRWTIEQVQTRLAPPPPEPKPEPPKPEPRVIEVPRAQIAEWRSASETIPAAKEAASPGETPSHGMPKWIIAGLIAVVLVVIALATLRRREPAPQVATTAVTHSTVVPTPAPEPAPAPAIVPEPPKPSPVGGRRTQGWAVIVAAYGGRDAAEKRMREMSKRFSKFNISVTEQKSERARFLVVLGDNLSEDQAEALRQRAVRSGLPQDTYIKRVVK